MSDDGYFHKEDLWSVMHGNGNEMLSCSKVLFPALSSILVPSYGTGLENHADTETAQRKLVSINQLTAHITYPYPAVYISKGSFIIMVLWGLV